MDIILIAPTKENEDEILSYQNEFGNETIDGSNGLGYQSFNHWLMTLQLNETEETVKKGLVPSSTYIAIRKVDYRMVGIVDIRHYLNQKLLLRGGHIGYSVRKTERNQGYGKEIFRLALDKCKDLKIKEVLVTCDKDNIASAKVIKYNKGKQENEIEIDGVVLQRYWIVL